MSFSNAKKFNKYLEPLIIKNMYKMHIHNYVQSVKDIDSLIEEEEELINKNTYYNKESAS